MSIRIDGLVKSYGEREVLHGIDLEVPAGQIVGYIGPNGAGKTTTVKLLTGLIGQFAGHVSVCGFDVRDEALEVKRRIGLVPETAVFYDELSPWHYLQFLGQIHALPDGTLNERASMLLELFELAAKADAPIGTLSKGMRQKLLLAAALLHDPEVLFLDEPLSGLDASSVVLVKEIIAGMVEGGKTVFYCSHVMDVVERLCDRIVILDAGKVVADGTFDALRERVKGESLESVFTRLTSAGGQEAAAERFVQQLGRRAER